MATNTETVHVNVSGWLLEETYIYIPLYTVPEKYSESQRAPLGCSGIISAGGVWDESTLFNNHRLW